MQAQGGLGLRYRAGFVCTMHYQMCTMHYALKKAVHLEPIRSIKSSGLRYRADYLNTVLYALSAEHIAPCTMHLFESCSSGTDSIDRELDFGSFGLIKAKSRRTM